MYQRLAGDDDRLKLRGPIERAVFAGSKHGFRSVGVANRTFAGNPKRSTPDRPSTGGEGSGLFDLNPTDEQKMIVDTTREFAAEKLRPAATAADTEAAPPVLAVLRQFPRRVAPHRGQQEGAAVINLETPKKFGMLINHAHQVSTEILRPISRKYDQASTAEPGGPIKELDLLASLIDGMNASGETSAGAGGVRRDSKTKDKGNRNGTNMSGVLSVIEGVLGRRRHGVVDATPGSRQRRDRVGGRRRAARPLRPPVGVDGHHRAELRFRLRRCPDHRHPRR